MEHLSPDTMRALEAGEPTAVAHFRDHLGEACEVCESFLATHDGPGLLDGMTDSLLLSVAPPREAQVNELEYARVRRALKGGAAAPRRWVGPAVAALAACLVAGVVVPQLLTAPGTSAGWDGLKAAGAHITVELHAAARTPDGQVRRLDPGASVTCDDVLALRYHATDAGRALLFLQEGRGGTPELLGEFTLKAGTHDLEGENGLAGVRLDEENGPVTVWLVAVPTGGQIKPEAVQQALKGAGSRDLQRLSTARFDVRVENSDNRP